MLKARSVKIGDVYCRQEPKTQKYFAFQIIEEKEHSLVYLLLDYFDEQQPDKKDLSKIQPFIRKRWFWNDSINLCHADTKDFPIDAVLVDNILPLVTQECKCYGGWPGGHDFVSEAEWLTFPEETRRRFKEGQKDTSEITVAGRTIRRSWQRIDDELLSAMTDYVKELYELPVAYSFIATKFYSQLIPFLETRHTAQRLEWDNHGQKELDLSHTHLQAVSIDDENMLVIRLPQSCTLITFKGKVHPDLRVEAPDGGKKLIVQINAEKQNGLVPCFGIPDLGQLTLLSVKGLDIRQIPQYYPRLNWLRLVGKPGNVENIDALSLLNELKGIIFDDIFGFTGEEFPKPESWADLKRLSLDSVPEEAGKYIKKLFKGKVDDLDIRKLRKPEWLAENLDNPLRHWDGSEFVPKSKFNKAVIVYRNARRAALSAASDYVAGKDSAKLQKCLEEISDDYVKSFNKLDARTNWIETEEREDICAAFETILNAIGDIVGSEFEINRSQIYNAMDEHRDW